MRLATPDPSPWLAVPVERTFNCRCVLLPVTSSQHVVAEHPDGRRRTIPRRMVAEGYLPLIEGDILRDADEFFDGVSWKPAGASFRGRKLTPPPNDPRAEVKWRRRMESR